MQKFERPELDLRAALRIVRQNLSRSTTQSSAEDQPELS